MDWLKNINNSVSGFLKGLLPDVGPNTSTPTGKTYTPPPASVNQQANVSSLLDNYKGVQTAPINYTPVPSTYYTEQTPSQQTQLYNASTPSGPTLIAPPTVRTAIPANYSTSTWTPPAPSSMDTGGYDSSAYSFAAPSFEGGASSIESAGPSFASVGGGGSSYSGGASTPFPGSATSGFAGTSGTGPGYGSIVNAEEEKKKKKLLGANNPNPMMPQGVIPYNGYNIPAGFTPTMTPQGGTAYRDPNGNLYIPQYIQGQGQALMLAPNTLPGVQNNNIYSATPQTPGYVTVNTPQIAVQPRTQAPLGAPSSSFSAGAAPKTLDMAAQSAAQKITEMLKDPKLAQDPAAAQKMFQDFYSLERQKLEASEPTPPNPVVETQEQQEWLQQFEEQQKNDIMAQMDAKRQELGLTALEAKKIQTQKDIQATKDAFRKITDDIKNNPDLPKGLAAKRIKEFTDNNAINIENMLSELDILEEQITNANNALNNFFNIKKFQADEDYRQNDLAMRYADTFAKMNEGVIKNQNDLRKEFNALKTVQEFNDIQNSYAKVNQSYNEAISKNTGDPRDPNVARSKAAADQALITSFNKMLDPSSVVREGEYARSVEGQSAMNYAAGLIERITRGGAGLTDLDRKAIVDITKRLYDSYLDMYHQDVEFYSGVANDMGVDFSKVARDPKTVQEATQLISPQTSTPTPGSIIVNSKGQRARVNADGTVTPL